MNMLGDEWKYAPLKPVLSADSVHLWAASLDLSGALRRFYLETFSPEEQKRVDRYLMDYARQQFIAGRGLLRVILGRYLGLEPREIRFIYSGTGKPALAPVSGHAPIYFNVSHSNGWALFAFSGQGEIGVDLEFAGRRVHLEETAAVAFSPGEIASLKDLPPEEQRLAFFRYWSRKEAYIKGLGIGGTVPLRQMEVLYAPDRPVAELDHHGNPVSWTDWYVRDVPLGVEFAAAIAHQGRDWDLSLFRGPDVDVSDSLGTLDSV